MPSTLARLAVPLLAAALLAAGCGGSETGSTGDGGRPEKTHIVVGALPVPDSAPLYIAIKRGFFKQQGLTVTPETIQLSPQATPKLLAGTMDFSLMNYVSTLQIQALGSVRFRITNDSAQSAPGTFALVVPKDSPITSPAGIKGTKIGVPGPKAVMNVGIYAVAATYGIRPAQMTFVTVPFPNMQAALKTGQIDAAGVVEPFITAITASGQGRVLTDIMTGRMKSFPIAGWGTLQQYAQRYPNTVAAFQRAMARAQRIAAGDRTAVEQVVPGYTEIKGPALAHMHLVTFPTGTLSAARLQRVADALRRFGLIHKRLDVGPMILPMPRS